MIRRLPDAEARHVGSARHAASVEAIVEQLVLNALDAGATAVAVSCDLGQFVVAVRDNGAGIAPSELPRVGELACTSKAEGVGSASTYGYRGEALFAIGLVSTLEIVSRTARETAPHMTVVRNGNRVMTCAAASARARGTTATVRDLFFNRPVQRKMLLRPGAIAATCERVRQLLARIALAHGNVGFSLRDVSRGQLLLETQPSVDMLGQLRQLFRSTPHRAAFRAVAAECSAVGARLSGFVCSADAGHRSAELQLLFINRRALARRDPLVRLVVSLLSRAAHDDATPSPRRTPGRRAGGASVPKSRAEAEAAHAAFVLRVELPRQEVALLHDEGGLFAHLADERAVHDFVKRAVATGRVGSGCARPASKSAGHADDAPTGSPDSRPRADEARESHATPAVPGGPARAQLAACDSHHESAAGARGERMLAQLAASAQPPRIAKRQRLAEPSSSVVVRALCRLPAWQADHAMPRANDPAPSPLARGGCVRARDDGAAPWAMRAGVERAVDVADAQLACARAASGAHPLARARARAHGSACDLGLLARADDTDSSCDGSSDSAPLPRAQARPERAPRALVSCAPLAPRALEDASRCASGGGGGLPHDPTGRASPCSPPPPSCSPWRRFSRDGPQFDDEVDEPFKWRALALGAAGGGALGTGWAERGAAQASGATDAPPPVLRPRVGPMAIAPLPLGIDAASRTAEQPSCVPTPHSSPPFEATEPPSEPPAAWADPLRLADALGGERGAAPTGAAPTRRSRPTIVPPALRRLAVAHLPASADELEARAGKEREGERSGMLAPTNLTLALDFDLERDGRAEARMADAVDTVDAASTTAIVPLRRASTAASASPAGRARALVPARGVGGVRSLSVSREALRSAVVIGQVDSKWIAVTLGSALALIDQHAADERVQLERLLAVHLDADGLPREPRSVRLEPAERLALSAHELALLREHMRAVQLWGWQVRGDVSAAASARGGTGGDGHGLLLVGAPAVCSHVLRVPALAEYLALLDELRGCPSPPRAVLRAIISKACRSAIMFGTQLSHAECARVVAELGRAKFPFQCAHGRPTIVPFLELPPLP
ncbi:hypothetical protein KFE25_009229 [Diacronema lutheri]|uniref:MutL C-terminal dimerisation domain-containing protein n=2 Tax=Diacronema lutheri TaxID=2081491 RepID=A0A8J5XMC8_DIALT|nr:hypothetical protein KFE25_009229 [Diacronema lutheri]